MMIDLGIPEILKRHVADTANGFFYIDRTLPNLFEEGAELIFIHEVSA